MYVTILLFRILKRVQKFRSAGLLVNLLLGTLDTTAFSKFSHKFTTGSCASSKETINRTTKEKISYYQCRTIHRVPLRIDFSSPQR